jgi:hypothetical protein
MPIGIENIKSSKYYSFLVSNMLTLLFHGVLLIVIGSIWGHLRLIFLFIMDDQIGSIITSFIIAGFYGLAWYRFWSNSFHGKIKWFYSRVTLAIIPLVIFLILFDPVPDPMAMISVKTEPIFSCLMTGIILLPIYSLSLYKFVLPYPIRKVKKYILLLAMIVLGSGIYALSWNTMHLMY